MGNSEEKEKQRKNQRILDKEGTSKDKDAGTINQNTGTTTDANSSGIDLAYHIEHGNPGEQDHSPPHEFINIDEPPS